jgi:hypothetical protein
MVLEAGQTPGPVWTGVEKRKSLVTTGVRAANRNTFRHVVIADYMDLKQYDVAVDPSGINFKNKFLPNQVVISEVKPSDARTRIDVVRWAYLKKKREVQ